MRKRNPTSISDAINIFLRNLGVEGKVKEAMAVSDWDKLVGPYIARHSEAERVENGVLYVKVTDPVWKHHLFLMRREIIKKINEKLEFDAIREIVFYDTGSDFKNKIKSDKNGEGKGESK